MSGRNGGIEGDEKLLRINERRATETLTALMGLPLVAQTYRSLDLPQSVARHLRLKQRPAGLGRGDACGELRAAHDWGLLDRAL